MVWNFHSGAYVSVDSVSKGKEKERKKKLMGSQIEYRLWEETRHIGNGWDEAGSRFARTSSEDIA